MIHLKPGQVTGLLLFTTLHTSAQLLQETPSRWQLAQHTRRTLDKKGTCSPSATAEKPAGVRQRLVQTLSETGMPGAFSRTADFRYRYSGDKSTHTPLYQTYPVSDYDSAYNLLSGSYHYQRLHTSGSLARNLQYRDMSPGSGPGAYQYAVKDYDPGGRLLLDSLYQAGPQGTNLSIKDAFVYDSGDRISYADYVFESYDPGGIFYSSRAWKFYFQQDTLPAYDSMIVNDNGSTATKLVRHYYDGARLLADSTWIDGAAEAGEVTLYTYNPAGDTRTGNSFTRQGATWQADSRHTLITDDRGRTLRDQGEVFENNAWRHDYRNDRQFSDAAQPDSLPTVYIIYGSQNNTWVEQAREVRHINAQHQTDTLSYYVANGVPGAMRLSGRRVFHYNSYGNLTQDYMHNYREDGAEINGYYTDYYYEVATLPIAARDRPELVVSLYPNPARGLLYIRKAARRQGLLRLKISDISGRVLQEQTMDGDGGQADISHLGAGTYLALLTDEQGAQAVRRFVVR